MAIGNETAAKETLKTITISLPATMAAKAEALAEEEGRTMSDVFNEALTRNPHGYTEDDIPRLIKEAHAEMAAEVEAALKPAKAS